MDWSGVAACLCVVSTLNCGQEIWGARRRYTMSSVGPSLSLSLSLPVVIVSVYRRIWPVVLPPSLHPPVVSVNIFMIKLPSHHTSQSDNLKIFCDVMKNKRRRKHSIFTHTSVSRWALMVIVLNGCCTGVCFSWSCFHVSACQLTTSSSEKNLKCKTIYVLILVTLLRLVTGRN